ncbi:MAG: ADP-ribosylglycohydrolase family protein [Anaerolineales bacterium]|nr:ADP-ribosylglycohydrolase family protein [Anaerolineales bacterium]
MEKERFRGSLLGLAVGDAVGTTLEFKAPGSFDPIDDMVGGGPFRLEPGQWTDDTSMALCLAASLIEKRGFDAADQMRRYTDWYEHGYMSSNGTCFDIGNTVRHALHRFQSSGDPYSGSTDPHTAGNGSLMRLAPVVLYYAGNMRVAMNRAAQSSRTTHGAKTAVDACRYMAAVLINALNGTLKRYLFFSDDEAWVYGPLADEIHDIRLGSFKEKQPPEIQGTGYVVKSLEAALWAFWNSKNFRDGCLLAANLGDDADTTAAIFGQLAGAYYGESGIPAEWREKITMRDQIIEMADTIYERSQEMRFA